MKLLLVYLTPGYQAHMMSNGRTIMGDEFQRI